jgi:hypothetical protein
MQSTGVFYEKLWLETGSFADDDDDDDDYDDDDDKQSLFS